jgi:hypothetical protein
VDHPEHVAAAVTGDVVDRAVQETRADVAAAIAAEAVVPGASGHRSAKIQDSKNA